MGDAVEGRAFSIGSYLYRSILFCPARGKAFASLAEEVDLPVPPRLLDGLGEPVLLS
jgi:hypothetical protein